MVYVITLDSASLGSYPGAVFAHVHSNINNNQNNNILCMTG